MLIHSEGELIHILEEDDGSGWVKVINDCDKRGLVPATYIEPAESSELESASAQEGAGQHGKSMFHVEHFCSIF